MLPFSGAQQCAPFFFGPGAADAPGLPSEMSSSREFRIFLTAAAVTLLLRGLLFDCLVGCGEAELL